MQQQLPLPPPHPSTLQGIVGSTPWNALVFLTLYFQLLGFSDAAASALVALFGAGAAAGSLLGGWLGDRVAERHPHHGRIALVQVGATWGRTPAGLDPD